MRGQLSVLVLLAIGLSACGSNSQNNSSAPNTALGSQGTSSSSVAATSSTPAASGTTAAKTSTTSTPTPANIKPAGAVRGTYVQPTVTLKYKMLQGKAPAVVLLPDTNNSASAEAEAKKLAALGIGSYVVKGSNVDPTSPAAFNQAVGVTLAAVDKLRHQAGVDPTRVGIIAEGVGAHVGAIAIGKQPGKVLAAVLADIGGTVVPSPAYAPEKWLGKAEGIQLLFQRDEAKRAMTQDEIKRLMVSAPPGTLMEQYKALGVAAQKSRDEWIKGKLLAG